MKAYLEPVFNLLTGVGFLIFLLVVLRVRSVLKDWAGRFLQIALLLLPLGFFLMAAAGQNNTLNKASPMLLAAGGVFLTAAIMLGLGMLSLAQSRK